MPDFVPHSAFQVPPDPALALLKDQIRVLAVIVRDLVYLAYPQAAEKGTLQEHLTMLDEMAREGE